MDQDPEAAPPASRLDFSLARSVLLVDDDELVLEHLSATVRAAGFDVHTARDGASALTFLQQHFTPIVIADRNMPAMDGLALCRAVRQQIWPGYVYMLLLTVQDGEADILAGLEAGADDYLSKRSSSAQLVARLHAAQRIVALEQALKAELEEKRRQSLTDALTGAHNRRYFELHLQRDFKHTLRACGSLALMMLDIDHFKRINDRHGHAAGDAVLQEVVRRIAQCLPRETDWCARVGGEEFVIVLADTPLSGAAQVAERIRQMIAGVPIATSAGAVGVTASIGVVEFQPAMNRESVSVESLIRELDANMYRSKQNGRNRVTLPQPLSSRPAMHPSPLGAAGSAAQRPPLRTLLYVDDEPDLRLMVQAALTLAEGLTVHTAESGEQALELARELHPDLLLLDVAMPGLDGPTTLKRLRADAAMADIPVIFATAKATPEELMALRALGASGVIAKPFDRSKICGKVLSLWQGIAASRPCGGNAPDRVRLREQIARQAGKFLQRCETQSVALRELIQDLQAGDTSSAISMRDIAHTIHGSGAVFNFPAVSQHAGELERLSEQLLAAATLDWAPGSQLRQSLQACLRELARAIDAASAGHAAAIPPSATQPSASHPAR
jgi:diguanylate cyclase (GGDEF)-like protein